MNDNLNYVRCMKILNDRKARRESRKEKTMKKWYAVQETRADLWDYGTFDKNRAIEMLREQGHGLIAVIEDDFCVEEIPFEEVAE